MADEPPDEQHAARKVFDVAELLENILLHVDIKTLLLSQRVDRTFHATIAGSKLLQEKLFFRATAPVDPALKLHKNPLVFDDSLQQRMGIETLRQVWSWTLSSSHYFDCIFSPSRDLANLPQEPSWRRMLVIQPTTEMNGKPWVVDWMFRCPASLPRFRRRWQRLEFEAPPTMDQLLKEVTGGRSLRKRKLR